MVCLTTGEKRFVTCGLVFEGSERQRKAPGQVLPVTFQSSKTKSIIFRCFNISKYFPSGAGSFHPVVD